MLFGIGHIVKNMNYDTIFVNDIGYPSGDDSQKTVRNTKKFSDFLIGISQ